MNALVFTNSDSARAWHGFVIFPEGLPFDEFGAKYGLIYNPDNNEDITRQNKTRVKFETPELIPVRHKEYQKIVNGELSCFHSLEISGQRFDELKRLYPMTTWEESRRYCPLCRGTLGVMTIIGDSPMDGERPVGIVTYPVCPHSLPEHIRLPDGKKTEQDEIL